MPVVSRRAAAVTSIMMDKEANCRGWVIQPILCSDLYEEKHMWRVIDLSELIILLLDKNSRPGHFHNFRSAFFHFLFVNVLLLLKEGFKALSAHVVLSCFPLTKVKVKLKS